MAVIDKVIENAQDWVERHRKYLLETLADIKKATDDVEKSLSNGDNYLENRVNLLKILNDTLIEQSTEYKSCKAMVRMLKYNKQEDEKKEKEAVTN